MKKRIINNVIELVWDDAFCWNKYQGDDTFCTDKDGYICGLLLTTSGKQESGSDFIDINLPTIDLDYGYYERFEVQYFLDSKRQYYFNDNILFDYRDLKDIVNLVTLKYKVINDALIMFFNEDNQLEFLLITGLYSYDFYPNSLNEKPIRLSSYNLSLKEKIWTFIVKAFLYQYDCSLEEYLDAIDTGKNLLRNNAEIHESVSKFIESYIEFWEELIQDELNREC